MRASAARHARNIAIIVAACVAIYGTVWLVENAYGLVRDEPCEITWMASSTDQSGRTHTTSNCDPR